MSAQDRLEKATKLTARIVSETLRAIALHATWTRCADKPELGFQLRNEPAFPVVRDALLIDLTMTLCRLHEVGQDASATFPRIFRALDGPAAVALLRHPANLDRAKQRYTALKAGGAIGRVRDLRDRVLAHNDTRGMNAGPIHGDATELMNATVELAVLLHHAVTGSVPEFHRHAVACKLGADSFWRRIASDGTANDTM